ncbi:MAG: carboxypeptidase-like regulatory domain-containing protein [Candidatus Obscuribacterales bacterium]|nr:carboxypeptidase-like regulatory domain-containing protein [Candidatus Obscuribacterales bacterium]
MAEKQVTHALQGHVKHQGLPVAGVNIRVTAPSFVMHTAQKDEPLQEVVTGSKGEFSFALPSGSYIVDVIPSGRTRFLKERLSDIELTSNTTCNVSLTTGTLLTGSVIAPSGERLHNAEVMAIGIEPTPYAATSGIDDDGTYALVLPKGKFHVASRHRSDRDDTNVDSTENSNGFACNPYVNTQVHVVNVVVDGSLDILLPDLCKFHGQIEDVFGHAVVNAKVKLVPVLTNQDHIVVKEFDLYAECLSDADGCFEMLLEKGVYELEIVPAPLATHFGLKESNIRISNDTERKFILEEGHKLKGEVLYEDTPLSSCLVRAQDASSSKEFIAKTDKFGQFSLGVPGGNYKLIVVAHPRNAPTVTIDGAEHTGIAPWSKIVMVGGDTHVSVDLRAGTALQGRVRDDSGQARAGMQISVFADGAEGLGPETTDPVLALAHSVTDADGRYSIFLSPGAYSIVVHKDFENATPIEVGSEPVNQDIIWHGWCQIMFELVGEDGNPVPRCQMEYHPYGERADDDGPDDDASSNLPRGYVLTDEDGCCQVTIPQGVYTFRFNPPNSGSYEAKDIRQLSISADITRKVVLNLKRNV